MVASGNAYGVAEVETEVDEPHQRWSKRGIRYKQLMCYYPAWSSSKIKCRMSHGVVYQPEEQDTEIHWNKRLKSVCVFLLGITR